MASHQSHRTQRRFLMAMLAGGLFLLGACGGDDDDSSAGSGLSAVSITTGFKYAPPDLTVPAGGEVSVTNTDTQTHTLTADEGGAFDLTLEAGGAGVITAPSEPGTFRYHCSYHPIMTAQLVVE
jgi:plastocyanin